MNRPGLKRLMEMVKSNQVSTIIVYKIDRISRSASDFYQLVNTFDKHKVGFISITEDINTTSPIGKYIRAMMIAFAEMERDLISERTVTALAHLKKQGLRVGQPPYGWHAPARTEEEKKSNAPRIPLAPVESEQIVVRRILDLRESGYSLRAIADLLNEEGYRTRTGSLWQNPYVHNVLKNNAERGEAA